MLVKKYNSIMEKPQNERARWAVGLSIVVYVFIFTGFALNKGYISINTKNPENSELAAVVVSAEDAPSPLDRSKGLVSELVGEVKAQYGVLRDSLESVFVPFFTSIEIYEGVEK